MLSLSRKCKVLLGWLKSRESSILLRLLFILGSLFLVILPLSFLFGIFLLRFPWIIRYTVFGLIGISIVFFFAGIFTKRYRMSAWRYSRNSLIVLCVLYTHAILFLTSITFLQMMGMRLVSEKLIFPLGQERKSVIALDSKGHIFYPIESYKRIQVYNEEGRFIRGWFAPIYSDQIWDIYIDTNDNLHVIVNEKEYIYDINGRLLTKQKVMLATKRLCSGQKSIKDNKGNTYSVIGTLAMPKIVKITPEGKESVIAENSLDLLLNQMPLQWFLVWFLSIIFSVLIAQLIEDESARQQGIIPIQFE